MTIRMSSAQVVRVQEAMDNYFARKWTLKLATEDFVEEILDIIIPLEEVDDHKHTQEPGTSSGV